MMGGKGLSPIRFVSLHVSYIAADPKGIENRNIDVTMWLPLAF